MAVVNGYASAQELRDHFGDAGNKLTLALLERAINATSRAIDKFTGRRFWQDAVAVARVYRPQDAYEVFVDDISTSTGLIIKTDTTGDGTYDTTWAAADYQLEPLNADLGDAAFAWESVAAVDDKTFPISAGDGTLDTRGRVRRPVRRPSLQVTARFGWSAVPDDVNEACILRAAAIFKRKEAIWGVAGFGRFGEIRITRKDPDVMDLLAPFRRITTPDV